MCHHERKPLLFSLVLNLHIKSRELPTFSNTLSPPKGTSSGSPWNFAPNIGLPTPVLKFLEIWEQDLERTEFGEEKKLSKEGDAIESTIQSCCFFSRGTNIYSLEIGYNSRRNPGLNPEIYNSAIYRDGPPEAISEITLCALKVANLISSCHPRLTMYLVM